VTLTQERKTFFFLNIQEHKTRKITVLRETEDSAVYSSTVKNWPSPAPATWIRAGAHQKVAFLSEVMVTDEPSAEAPTWTSKES